MDMLTAKIYEQIVIKDLDIIGIGEKNANVLEKATIRLHEYELTGLVPSDIEVIKECQSNIIAFVMNKKELERKYNTLLEMYSNKQKELETWKREAIESKAQLGEIRIKLVLEKGES